MVIIFYLVGIKGTGMSALAVVLHQLQEEVVGSDSEKLFFTDKNLISNGIRVLPFNSANILENQKATFIIGHAYDENNEEVKTIFTNNYKYYYYSDFINNYFLSSKIGVSGTHGKTTTTSMISHFFKDQKTVAIIGDGTGKATVGYQYFIFEACEYKLHFLNYDYDYLVITNIDYDHPDFYHNIEDVVSAFQKAAKKAKILIKNNDDLNSQKINHPHVVTFGIHQKSDVQGQIIKKTKQGFILKITINNHSQIINFPFNGKHMIYNFLASLACYYLVHENTESIQDMINSFVLPKRRQEEYHFKNNIIIDDYAHHPTEIKAAIEGIKQKYPKKNITVIFQPHTYSRTIFLDKEFQRCFPCYVDVYIAPTFTSREEKDSMKQKIVDTIFSHYQKYDEKTISFLKQKENSVIVFMGAGDIHNELKYFIN